jgi:hypothetical protein
MVITRASQPARTNKNAAGTVHLGAWFNDNLFLGGSHPHVNLTTNPHLDPTNTHPRRPGLVFNPETPLSDLCLGVADCAARRVTSIERMASLQRSPRSRLYPTYVRGEAYLAAGQGSAAAEFQEVLDPSGIVWNCWTEALAHLGVARPNGLESRTAPVRSADADAARTRALAAYGERSTPSCVCYFSKVVPRPCIGIPWRAVAMSRAGSSCQ